MQREIDLLARVQGLRHMRDGPVDAHAVGRQDEPIGPAPPGDATVRVIEQRDDQAVLGTRLVVHLHVDVTVGARQLPNQ
jgi:hypothetical protein